MPPLPFHLDWHFRIDCPVAVCAAAVVPLALVLNGINERRRQRPGEFPEPCRQCLRSLMPSRTRANGATAHAAIGQWVRKELARWKEVRALSLGLARLGERCVFSGRRRCASAVRRSERARPCGDPYAPRHHLSRGLARIYLGRRELRARARAAARDRGRWRSLPSNGSERPDPDVPHAIPTTHTRGRG